MKMQEGDIIKNQHGEYFIYVYNTEVEKFMLRKLTNIKETIWWRTDEILIDEVVNEIPKWRSK